EGREEGREEALKSSVLAVVEARFEMVPRDVEEGVKAVDLFVIPEVFIGNPVSFKNKDFPAYCLWGRCLDIRWSLPSKFALEFRNRGFVIGSGYDGKSDFFQTFARGSE
ncbi:hypothetical protein M1M99_03500, partial [Thermodesulfovibrionales bacterium]|nr:hypothetical protein [Thermodesulfovibrionales bacterium]